MDQLGKWRKTIVALVAVVGCAQPRTASPPVGSCTDPPTQAISFIDVPGRPFLALPSSDGCWVFATLGGFRPADGGSLAALSYRGGKLRVERVVHVGGQLTGMQLTHDGKMLVLANGADVTFADVDRLIAGQGGVIRGRIAAEGNVGRIYVNVTSDDRFAFVPDENAATITVVDLEKARGGDFSAALVGRIPTGRAPIAVTFSSDERLLYTTAQVIPTWPVACKPESAAPGAAPDHPRGAIVIVDVARATVQRDPAHAVVGVVPAGCNMVRLVLSPDGRLAYATARDDNAVLVFDTAKLMSDPAHAQVAAVPVGTAPVGLAVVDSGRRLLATNSNRFGGGSDDKQSVNVIDASRVNQGAAAVIGSIPAGAFPREMRAMPNGRVLLLTNFNSANIELIDLTKLP